MTAPDGTVYVVQKEWSIEDAAPVAFAALPDAAPSPVPSSPPAADPAAGK